MADCCRGILKKRKVLIKLTYYGPINKGDKKALLKIFDEFNEMSIPIKIRKKTELEEIIIK
jgi:hypothetical protein